MPDKLTDAEVKKALEEWIKNYDGSYVNFKTLGNVLDLINRQEEEKQNLKAEIEKLQNAYKQCAWERDIFAEDMKEEIKKDCSYLMLDIKTIKAEAYKEFAEELKLRTHEISYNTMQVVNKDDINNLLNELVGGADGEND